MRRWLLAVLAVVMASAGCDAAGLGDDGDDDLRRRFEREIAPLIERDCGTNVCHAASDAQFDELPEEYFVFPVDDSGRITPGDRMDKAYQRSLAKLSAAGGRHADLIRKPLDEALGGSAHRGGAQYRTETDPSYQTLLAWADDGAPADELELPPLAKRFAADVQPVLAAKRCMISSCHGASSANFLKLDPGVVGEIDAHQTLRNYEKTVLFLAFDVPDPMMSRLIRKTIPIEQGGIFHRGGNDFFDPSAGDPDLAAIVDFVTHVRTEVGDADKGEVTGVVFAATDPTPRRLFDIAMWQPGGDVYSLIPAAPGGQLTNLTAALHTGPADIRDPAVSYDGQRVAFSMRRSEDDCLNLYVMNLDGSGLVQLTHDTGTLPSGIKVSNVEPLWGPDDRIYFVSTRRGVLAANSGLPLSNLWRIDSDGAGLLQMTFSAGNEVAPGWRFAEHHSEHALEVRALDLSFTAARRTGGELFAPIMRVPPDFHADYHPHYGTQNPTYEVFTQITMMPDMRDTLVLMDDDNLWEGGALGLIDRNLGPVIADGNQVAVVNYVEPLQKLAAIGDVVEHRGSSPHGYYRDPFSLPDGSLLVVHSRAAIDHADPAANPDPALYRMTLLELAGNHTVVSRKDLLVDLPGKVEMDPRPIMRRRRESVGDPLHHLSNDVDYGHVLNFDLAVSLLIAGEDSPSGTKDFEALAQQIRWVRIVEEVPAQPGDQTGRGGRGVRRVLAEFPATADRSMYLRLPAGVPYFMQALDDTRMAVAGFNQWFFVLPGEQLKQVTRREVYDGRCGACHGSISGVPGDTVATPDVLTEASRVVANYDVATRTDKDPLPFGLDPTTREEVDFERDVQPILTARCATAGCHVGGGAVPDLSQRPGAAGFSGAYEALTAPGTDSANGFAYVDPIGSSARRSFLAEMLVDRELAAPGQLTASSCPGGSSLTLTEIATLMRWMDLGASYTGIAPKVSVDLPTY